MQHGFGRSSRFWYSWVPYLSRYYRVLTPEDTLFSPCAGSTALRESSNLCVREKPNGWRHQEEEEPVLSGLASGTRPRSPGGCRRPELVGMLSRSFLGLNCSPEISPSGRLVNLE